MSVKVRPYRNGGWEVDITFRLPDGRNHRERSKAPVGASTSWCAGVWTVWDATCATSLPCSKAFTTSAWHSSAWVRHRLHDSRWEASTSHSGSVGGVRAGTH